MTGIVSPARRNLTLGLLIVVAILSYVDRQVFTLFQDDIKAELGLSDGQLGLLTGMSFALFYTIASFPIARYADRGDRRLTIAVCVIVWSAATALCGMAQNFWQMVLARIGLAAGEAGAGPAGNSLLTEIFPLERRTTVISVMLAANAVGISGGLALGGWLSQYFGWRAVFLILGLPGILIGLAVWAFCAEPRRGVGAVTIPPQQIPMREVLRTMAGNPSLRWVALLLTMVPLTGFAFILWGASFFQRVHGMGKAETGFWLGGAMAAGLVIGNLIAGWVSDRYGKANPRFNGWFAGLGLIASFPFGVGFALSANPYVALACFVVVKFMMTLHLGPIISLCYAQVPVAMRAMMSATIGMVIGLSGMGIGGTVAGYVSQAFAADYGDRSLQPALALISLCLLVGGFAAIMAGRTAKPLAEDA
ncbi:MFS transporter [Novosphingobium arvoryzae]|uniref:MFS transporter n=1 Tax=Novosphingobium arvoryzae TaxID=1256514 RepID=A0A918RP84_9SPHN|nr:MFS transporter [Novosphingobium arvoryzae]GHA05254.1 MFS transporter [Novosphingobium arvoryzae]